MKNKLLIIGGIIGVFVILLISLFVFTISMTIKEVKKVTKEIQVEELYNENKDYTENIDLNDVNILRMDIRNATLNITSGDKFKVESNKKNIDIKNEYNQIEMLENNTNKNSYINKDAVVNIEIPNTISNFQETTINVGTGNLNIDNINTTNMKVNLGTGNLKLNNLEITQKLILSEGTGNITIKNSKLNNTTASLGTGKSNINAKLTGETNINIGIGEANINLSGTKEDYSVKLEKGIEK